MGHCRHPSLGDTRSPSPWSREGVTSISQLPPLAPRHPLPSTEKMGLPLLHGLGERRWTHCSLWSPRHHVTFLHVATPWSARRQAGPAPAPRAAPGGADGLSSLLCGCPQLFCSAAKELILLCFEEACLRKMQLRASTGRSQLSSYRPFGYTPPILKIKHCPLLPVSTALTGMNFQLTTWKSSWRRERRWFHVIIFHI